MNINMRFIKGAKAVRKEGLIFIVVSNTGGKRSIGRRQSNDFFIKKEYSLQHFVKVANKLANK
jgi:hypothetical protein